MEFPDPKEYFEAAQTLQDSLTSCRLCPRQCKVNRLFGEKGFCQAGLLPEINVYMPHFGEEPCISGTKGSGTIFFAGCTMRCLYCQNHYIAHQGNGEQTSAINMAEIFLELEQKGVHNINLVTPTPHIVTILKALSLAREAGLSVPIVYNTSGYEDVNVLKRLAGKIEIYLPDYKYYDPMKAEELSDAFDYPQVAAIAIQEMINQTGHLQLDANGMAQKGVLIRHLVLPNQLSDTAQVLTYLQKKYRDNIWISLMSQYTPTAKTQDHQDLRRPITQEEYAQATLLLDKLGLDKGFIQNLNSATNEYLPSFR